MRYPKFRTYLFYLLMQTHRRPRFFAKQKNHWNNFKWLEVNHNRIIALIILNIHRPPTRMNGWRYFVIS